jgi:hypothetical protein
MHRSAQETIWIVDLVVAVGAATASHGKVGGVGVGAKERKRM